MILLIDSYDSFANNLKQLVSRNTGKNVITIFNDTFSTDEYDEFFDSILPRFEYVIIGPGPGHPSVKSDVGIIPEIFHRVSKASVPIPILGICLGFQCLCYQFDNIVSKLQDIKHGQIYDIYPIKSINNDLFEQTIQSFPSVRYHSLFVDIDKINDEIIPLAVCYEPNGNSGHSKRVLMAARHKLLPFYGVQYHPESICSENGDNLIKNFDRIANDYNTLNNSVNVLASSHQTGNDISIINQNHGLKPRKFIKNGILGGNHKSLNITAKKFKFKTDIKPIDICDFIYRIQKKPDFILLNSASDPGEWSIIGIPIEGQSEVITHSIDCMNEIKILQYGETESQKICLSESQTAWDFLGSKMKDSYVPRELFKSTLGENFHSRDLPFLGGYLGLFSYEEGKYLLFDKIESLCNANTPDLKLIFIKRFILYDHLTKDYFIMTIDKDASDDEWLNTLHERLLEEDALEKLKINLDSIPISVKDLCLTKDDDNITFDFPDRGVYEKQFQMCQDRLHSGDSYELCLTTQLKIGLPSYIEAWDVYKVLTLRKNPSPFSCFMSFDDVTLISSSPERFLSWKEGSNGNKVIELRPIKGTVKNTPEVNLAIASELLKTPKEMGENLMIVDLIRHDLHAFIDKVDVTQLMAVEEYKTVFQLVSVISGELEKVEYNGIDILHSSLPPGSMTGAPKKRSVEILQHIESLQTNGNIGGRRGLYSGVAGYWSVTDDSDWSVVIRSAFHYHDDKANSKDKKVWRIGAGGAITVLSDVNGEWDEMEVKLTSALQAFQ